MFSILHLITLHLYSSSTSFHLAFLELNLWRIFYQQTTVRLIRKIKRKRNCSKSQDKTLLDCPIRKSLIFRYNVIHKLKWTQILRQCKRLIATKVQSPPQKAPEPHLHLPRMEKNPMVLCQAHQESPQATIKSLRRCRRRLLTTTIGWFRTSRGLRRLCRRGTFLEEPGTTVPTGPGVDPLD